MIATRSTITICLLYLEVVYQIYDDLPKENYSGADLYDTGTRRFTLAILILVVSLSLSLSLSLMTQTIVRSYVLVLVLC